MTCPLLIILLALQVFSGSPSIITSPYGRVCKSERIIIHCAADYYVQWRSNETTIVIFQVLTNYPGDVVSREGYTSTFVSRNGIRVNSSLEYYANDGVEVTCEGHSETSSYSHPISQLPEAFHISSFIFEGNIYHIHWTKPSNTGMYNFRNCTVTAKNENDGSLNVYRISDEDVTEIYLKLNGTRYVFNIATFDSCNQSREISVLYSAGEHRSREEPNCYGYLAGVIILAVFLAMSLVAVVVGFLTVMSRQNVMIV